MVNVNAKIVAQNLAGIYLLEGNLWHTPILVKPRPQCGCGYNNLVVLALRKSPVYSITGPWEFAGA
ncbi:MAG: hypothetical protein C4551_05140 [Bacillota bacterium]|nr:MAG: hypothetical protein C4551_05140 [Bacillota bacterium]